MHVRTQGGCTTNVRTWLHQSKRNQAGSYEATSDDKSRHWRWHRWRWRPARWPSQLARATFRMENISPATRWSLSIS
ncbi:hypothetical protein JMJ78_0008165, partial [Colletotrichum scovillei]